MSEAMPLKGKPVADGIKSRVVEKVNSWRSKGVEPRIDTILVAGDPASAYYADSKAKAAAKLNIAFHLHEFPESVTEDALLSTIRELNEDPVVHGIMLELPLPSHVSTSTLSAALSPYKDVDGLSPANRLAVVTGEPGLYPATPLACIQLAKHYGYELSGKNVVLVGRGKTVGLPLMHLLLRENATVTVCHSRTPDIGSHLRRADLAFVAVGRAGLVTLGMVHPNLVVIDAGMNETQSGKMVGDVAPDVANGVAAMSPTPGGVGTVTTAQLFANLMHAIELQKREHGEA